MTCTIIQRGYADAAEFYLTVIPGNGTDPFAEAAAALHQHEACILLERIFVQSEVIPDCAARRRAAYGTLDDGVEPTWLQAPAGRSGSLAAIQIHAVSARRPPTRLGRHLRILRHPGAGLVTVSGLDAATSTGFSAQISDLWTRLVAELGQAGIGMERLARTWLWLDPMATWYGELNQARNACFRAHGLIASDGRPVHLPASTGIGLRPAHGVITAEAIAALDGPPPTLFAAGGRQNCALGYGSAFSRAATLRTPSGTTAYISGTAAIDAAGRTIFIGEREGQVLETIRCVTAILTQTGHTPADIVQGVAYGVDAEVLAIWQRCNPGWPLAPVLADICREDLLFEIELTASAIVQTG